MVVIVENKKTGEVRVLGPKPIRRTKPKLLEYHVSSAIIPMRRRREGETHDGCNKGYRATLLRALTIPPSMISKPCWKMWKRKHQHKKEGYPSAKALNEMGRCIHPCVDWMDYVNWLMGGDDLDKVLAMAELE